MVRDVALLFFILGAGIAGALAASLISALLGAPGVRVAKRYAGRRVAAIGLIASVATELSVGVFFVAIILRWLPDVSRMVPSVPAPLLWVLAFVTATHRPFVDWFWSLKAVGNSTLYLPIRFVAALQPVFFLVLAARNDLLVAGWGWISHLH